MNTVLRYFLILMLLLNLPAYAFGLCVDYDGDGVADACGSAGSIPEPSAPKVVDQQAASTYKPASRSVSKHVSSGYSGSSSNAVAAGLFGSFLSGFFSEIFNPIDSSTEPVVSGPSPEEIRRQQEIAAERERQEMLFKKDKEQLLKSLKGTNKWVQYGKDPDMGKLKLKTIQVQPGRDFSGENAVRIDDLDKAIVVDLKERNLVMEEIAKRLDKVYVPPLPAESYDCVLFLGTGHSPEEAQAQSATYANFFGEPANAKFKVCAFGETGMLKDVVKRSIPDKIKAELFSSLTDKTMANAAPMFNSKINRLFAHSNGATVAEVLIREDYIKVKEFHILGGDCSASNLKALNKLANEKNMDIYVYINIGDPIPFIPSYHQLNSQMTVGLSDLMETFMESSKDEGRVKVVFLKSPRVKDVLSALKRGDIAESHDLLEYLRKGQAYITRKDTSSKGDKIYE